MSTTKFISKSIHKTINSNGQQKTIVNIVNQTNNQSIRTRAISSKNNPKEFNILIQKSSKKGDTIVTNQSVFRLKENDIMKIFKSAENITPQKIKSFPLIQDKDKKHKMKIIKKIKKDKKDRSIHKSSKLSKSSSKKSKKIKGGFSSVVSGFNPMSRDYAPFQTLEQERSHQTSSLNDTQGIKASIEQNGGKIKKFKGGSDNSHFPTMNEAIKNTIDNKTPAFIPKSVDSQSGGKLRKLNGGSNDSNFPTMNDAIKNTIDNKTPAFIPKTSDTQNGGKLKKINK